MGRATIEITAAVLATLIMAGTAGAAATPEQKCQGAKNQAVGKYAMCRQGAEQDLALTGDTAEYDAKILKCEAKFAALWQKAMDKAAKASATCPDTPLTAADFKELIDAWSSNMATGLASGVLAGCVGTPDAVEACYSGPDGTDAVGVCRAGTRTCNATGTAWGACSGEVTPSTDVCGDNLDNDCDEVVDQDCVCVHNTIGSCYGGPGGTVGIGVCTAGMRTCNATGTAWGVCGGEVTPSTELCGDGIDNDCDGVADPISICPDLSSDPANCGSYGNNCYAGAVHSQWACVNGGCQFTGCALGYYDNGGFPDQIPGDLKCGYACINAGQELCNGGDDNCNGQIDENVVPPSPNQVCGVSPSASTPECSPYNGFSNPGGVRVECSNGSWRCTFNTAGTCNPFCGGAEVCDGRDTNCNGSVDEGADLCTPGRRCQNGACVVP